MPAKKKNKQEQLAEDIADLVGAGKEWHLESVDFSDPNRPKTCLEVDFPIVPINEIAQLEATSGALKKPIYQMSKWWARRCSSVFRSMLLAAATKAPEDESEAASLIWNAYYGNHQKNEAFRNLKVAEPFMGGGTTLVEGSRLGMQLFGCDLNPVAWFVVKNEITPVDIDEVKRLLAEIEAEVKPYIMPYFACDGPHGEKGKWFEKDTNERSGWKQLPEDFDIFTVPWQERPNYRYEGPEIIYTFWAKHGPCAAQGCGHRTPLLTTPVVAVKTLTVKYWPDYTCQSCGGSFDVEQYETRMAPDSPLAVAEGETPFASMNARGEFKCPHCGQIHTDVAGRMKSDSVSLGGKAKNKKVELSLLMHPDWLKGCGPTDAAGNSLGGSATDAPEATVRWLKERAKTLRLVEVRGKLPEEITCPDTETTFATGKEGGNIPKRSTFDCQEKTCGRQQDILDSIKRSNKTGPTSPYVIQGFSEKLKQEGAPGGGRFYTTAHNAERYTEIVSEWEGRREEDLKDFWPRSELPYGFMTHKLNGGIPNHGFTHWWKMFTPLQLLVHGQLLKYLKGSNGWSNEAIEIALGGFQQYLRIASMLTIWHQRNNQIAAGLSNNNFHPKSTFVEGGVFNQVGDGSWNSCIRGINSGIEWVGDVTEKATKTAIERLDASLADQLSGKSVSVKTNDPILDSITVTCESASDLATHQNETVDLVITDPPFGGLIHYSELSDFFYVWLRLALKDSYPDYFSLEYTPKAQEAVSNKARQDDPDAFYRQVLTDCWRESNRILKPGGLLAFTFHHSEDAPWIDVLESLFNAGFYLEATIPIRGDETKGKGEFGSRQIEYDIIHVCRKRLKEPTRVSWARLRRRIMDDVRELKKLLEQHSNEGLPDADLRVIKRGKALEYYSQHYGQVFVEHGREFSLKEALVGINQLLDDEDEQSADAPPITAEAFSRQLLRIFRRTDQVANDQMQKTLRGTGMSPADFEKRGWCKKEKKVFNMVSPLDWAQQWKGQNRKGMARDLDQTLFLIGACFEDSGIKVWDTLNSPNFRHHPAIPDLLEWFTSNGADNTVKAASHRARTIYLDWMERNKPEVESAQAEFDFLEE